MRSMPFKTRFLVGGMTHVPLFMFAMKSPFLRITKKLMMDKRFEREMMEGPRYLARGMLNLLLL